MKSIKYFVFSNVFLKSKDKIFDTRKSAFENAEKIKKLYHPKYIEIDKCK